MLVILCGFMTDTAAYGFISLLLHVMWYCLQVVSSVTLSKY